MKVYFSPLACSLATRITLSELGKSADFIEVDPITKRCSDGGDLRALSSQGLVPTLRLDGGDVLTENVAVLWHLAKGTALAPEGESLQLLRWLAFIGTELHQSTFSAFFDAAAPAEAREYAAAKSPRRLAYLNDHLEGREFLLSSFSVADAYLVTILNWAQVTPIDLSPYGAVESYLRRGLARPSIKDAIALELPLYLKERAQATTNVPAAQP